MILPRTVTPAIERVTDATGTTLTPIMEANDFHDQYGNLTSYAFSRRPPNVAGPPSQMVWRTPGGSMAMDKDALWSNMTMLDAFTEEMRGISPENQLWTAGLPIGS